MLYIIALIIFIAMLFFNMFLCGVSLTHLIDMVSLLLVVLSVVPMLFVSGMERDFIRSFLVISKKTENLTTIQLKRCKAAVSLTIKLLLCSGTLMTLVSAYGLLCLNPLPEQMFPSLAVASLCLVYALIPCFLLLPLQAKLTAKLINLQEDESYI